MSDDEKDRKVGSKRGGQEDKFEDIMLPSLFRERPRTPGDARTPGEEREGPGARLKGEGYRNLTEERHCVVVIVIVLSRIREWWAVSDLPPFLVKVLSCLLSEFNSSPVLFSLPTPEKKAFGSQPQPCPCSLLSS